MELRKTSENWNRLFDGNGEETTNKLESVQFSVNDNEGNTVGNASVREYDGNANINFPDGGNANVSVSGYDTIEKGVEMLKRVMGITE